MLCTKKDGPGTVSREEDAHSAHKISQKLCGSQVTYMSLTPDVILTTFPILSFAWWSCPSLKAQSSDSAAMTLPRQLEFTSLE